MRKSLFVLSFFILGSLSAQQNLNQFNWDDPVVFKNSGNPYVRSYGELSDSLSSLTDKKIDFYYHDNEYFAVQSWADYFNWFTTKYWYRFAISTDVYKFHYLTGNNVEMMRFLNDECVSETIHLSPAVAQVEWNRVNPINENRRSTVKKSVFTESAFKKENARLISNKKREDAISNRKEELQLSQSRRDLIKMQQSSIKATSRTSSLSEGGSSGGSSTAKNTSNTKGVRKN
ncbi:MAG: hypothetical protein AB8B73_00950 [Ekhidna sp.]